MFGEFWVSVPVKDVLKTSEFYGSLGFKTDFENGGKDVGVKFVAGSEGTVVWLYAEKVFEHFARIETLDAKKGAEVLLSIYVESKEKVDEIARHTFDGGGTVFGEPSWAFEWLYGCGIADSDGHRWMSVFGDSYKTLNLELINSESFSSGEVELFYAPRKTQRRIFNEI